MDLRRFLPFRSYFNDYL